MRSIIQNVKEPLVCDGGRHILKEHNSLNGIREADTTFELNERGKEGQKDALVKLAPFYFA